MELPLEMAGNALTEDLRDLLGGQFNETEFTGSLEEFVDRKGFAKDKVQTVFDLAEGIETAQVHGLTFSFGELGTQEKRPVIKALPYQLRGQTVGSLLEGLGVIHGQKGIFLFSERDASSIQFGFDKRVAVNPVSSLKREKGGDSQDHGTQLRVSKVEVVMSETASGLA
jgi:hypothetical protein